MIPLVGFAPNVDPTMPGVLTDCANVIPSYYGLVGAPTQVSIGAAALAAECRGAAVVTKLDATRRLFAGSATKLYELSGATWSDVSRPTTPYNLGADDRWAFAQYGDSTIAATPTAVLQRSTGAAFANITSSPQARCVEAAAGFVIVANTSTNVDAWYCSAYLDETDWTPSVTTQCATGRLVGGSGPINALRRFGDDVVAYKSGSMFHGRYVGSPVVWQWTQVSNDVGCVGLEAVVDTAIGHVFLGRDATLYVYDGTTPRPLVNVPYVRRWLVEDMDPGYAYRAAILYDRAEGRLWLFYVSAGSAGVRDRCLVYHIATQRWGTAHQTIEAAVNYTSPQVTYDGGGTLAPYSSYQYESAYAAAVTYDSLFWIPGQTTPGVFSSTHTLCTLSGQCASASLTTGDYGDEGFYTACSGVQLRYLDSPDTSVVTGYYKDVEGELVSTGESQGSADGSHDIRQRARWHRFKAETTGDFTVSAIRPLIKRAGRR